MKARKKIFGVAVNDLAYSCKRGLHDPLKDCNFYKTWQAMVSRCYSKNVQKRQPYYKGCKVCDEWLLFSNFKKWMETQDWEGKQLDKDLLVRGNRVYSPETCVFIDRKINSFVLERSASRGEYLIGVCKYKRDKSFIARGNGVYLGSFKTELEAHLCWLTHKLEKAKLLASEQTDLRVAKALIDRYENYVIN